MSLLRDHARCAICYPSLPLSRAWGRCQGPRASTPPHPVLGRWLSRCPAPPHPQAAPLNMSWALVEYGSASNPHHIGLLTAFQIVPPEFLLAGSSSHQAAI